jgi:hypothetical protein
LAQDTRLSLSAIAKLPRLRVRAADKIGAEFVWDKTSLYEVVKAAGVKFDEALRVPALANYLLVEAADGSCVICTARARSRLQGSGFSARGST